MVSNDPGSTRIAVFGVGNLLGTDDGVGVHVVRTLEEAPEVSATLIDAGTISFPLLQTIADHDALIVVDAARMGSAPGTVRSFEGPAMDEFLKGGRFRSVHDVSLAEMLHAARLTDCLPEQRALVGIEPERTELGMECSPPVCAAIPHAVATITQIIQRWHHER